MPLIVPSSGGEGTEMQGVGRVQSNKGSLGTSGAWGLEKSTWGCEMMDEFPKWTRRRGLTGNGMGKSPESSVSKHASLGDQQAICLFVVVFKFRPTAKEMQK